MQQWRRVGMHRGLHTSFGCTHAAAAIHGMGKTIALQMQLCVGATKGQQTLADASLTPELRKEKENMADFIAKKREIFLLQMSLDTKRAEIKKLDERARQREEALKKSEQMLEEDALRFDAFLKENDEKVQEAIKRAEVEAKAKQDKVRGCMGQGGLCSVGCS